MQIANALNNNIRILFNPLVEAFKLFDFLVVKSQDNRYLAQIIEIYDDKFDSSQNVAKLKLFYKISKDNEVLPYDSFVPNKECEILKIDSVDVQSFINQDKETFIFSKNAKDSQDLNIQFDFFNNNPVILSDKIDCTNILTANIAKELSNKKNTVIIDSTGIIDIKEAKKITAGKNFRIPLNALTIEYIFEKCLIDASLEFQAIGTEILSEIKKFALSQKNSLIPFRAFVKVLSNQYSATPYPELRLLLARIKKFQMEKIFAESKKEYECFNKNIEENKLTIIDLSQINLSWQKAYIEYICTEINHNIYLSARINDESFDVELINTIYNKKKNINFIPSVSYSYKKLPSIIQHCKNYILMPSLYQRTDFLDAKFALSNLIADEYILFGKNTDNFLFLAKNIESKDEEKKNYRKIALSYANKELQTKDEPIKETEKDYPDEAVSELSNFNQEQIEKNNLSAPKDEIKIEPEIEKIEEDKKLQIEPEAIKPDIIEEIPAEIELDQEIEPIENTLEEDTQDTLFEQVQEEIPAETIEKETITEEEIDLTETIVEVDTESSEEQEVIELSDDELDFYNTEAEDTEKKEENQVIIDNIEYKVQSDDLEEDEDLTSAQEEEIDLMEVASQSIDNHFEDVLNEEIKVSESNDNSSIDLDKSIDKEDLPIFTETAPVETQEPDYNEGDVITHSKYGRGVVIKTIQYEHRQLLQIEFEQAGKKLLDPKVANITLE